jgi:hypothetical protein
MCERIGLGQAQNRQPTPKTSLQQRTTPNNTQTTDHATTNTALQERRQEKSLQQRTTPNNTEQQPNNQPCNNQHSTAGAPTTICEERYRRALRTQQSHTLRVYSRTRRQRTHVGDMHALKLHPPSAAEHSAEVEVLLLQVQRRAARSVLAAPLERNAQP